MPSTLVQIEVGGILFDMDGVLVKSTSGDERYWTRWADRQQLSDSFDITRTHELYASQRYATSIYRAERTQAARTRTISGIAGYS